MKLAITGREETVRQLQRDTQAWGETERQRPTHTGGERDRETEIKREAD